MNRLKLTLLVAALGATISGSAFLATSTEAAAQATKLVFEERNENAVVTKSFEVNGIFEISWRATGGKFLVKVLDGGSDKEIISSAPQSREEAQSPMTGKLTHTGPGSFKLSVDAAGPWYVRVIERQ